MVEGGHSWECFFSALAGGPPNTTFSQNNGVIAITRCASRAAGIACCFWLILLGCFERLGAAALQFLSLSRSHLLSQGVVHGPHSMQRSSVLMLC